MNSLCIRGKKLLFLAGNAAQAKVVAAAKELGVYTIVTDYLEPDASPAKKIADEHWKISYADTDRLEKLCREKHVDGVLTCYHESAQIPYYNLCKRLGFPCYADLKQFELLTNKRLFKELCRSNGIGVIPEYDEEDALSGHVSYPVVVKPVDCCGSKGQAVCYDKNELNEAIKRAKEESISGNVIIEKYISNKNSFQVTYFFVNGNAYLIRTTDGYKGMAEHNLDRVALCSVSPSVYTEEYIRTTNDSFVNMLKSIGVRNGPVMAQGFYDQGIFRFYDPGRRFPGTDFEMVYKSIFGIDFMKMMVCYALTGNMPSISIQNDSVFLRGKKVVVLFPTLQLGTIAKIEGISELRRDPRIHRVQQKHEEGAVINQLNTVSQRICEVDFVTQSITEAKETIKDIQKSIFVMDTNGKKMIDSLFDVSRLMDSAEQDK